MRIVLERLAPEREGAGQHAAPGEQDAKIRCDDGTAGIGAQRDALRRAAAASEKMNNTTMLGGNRFKVVESIARSLPDVEVTTSWGAPSLKVRGKMFACMASHKSAEPDTLVVMMDFPDRDALIADDPGTYYLKDHYLNYPCVLVRLSRVRADALRDLVAGAYRFISAKAARKSPGARRRGAVRRQR